MMPEAAQRIRIIEASLRCFVLGWLSLLPVIGLCPALLEFLCHSKVSSMAGEAWNPAKRCLVAGHCLACLGSVVSFVALGLLLLRLILTGTP
jgi:hypothetical protein